MPDIPGEEEVAQMAAETEATEAAEKAETEAAAKAQAGEQSAKTEEPKETAVEETGEKKGNKIDLRKIAFQEVDRRKEVEKELSATQQALENNTAALKALQEQKGTQPPDETKEEKKGDEDPLDWMNVILGKSEEPEKEEEKTPAPAPGVSEEKVRELLKEQDKRIKEELRLESSIAEGLKAIEPALERVYGDDAEAKIKARERLFDAAKKSGWSLDRVLMADPEISPRVLELVAQDENEKGRTSYKKEVVKKLIDAGVSQAQVAAMGMGEPVPVPPYAEQQEKNVQEILSPEFRENI